MKTTHRDDAAPLTKPEKDPEPGGVRPAMLALLTGLCLLTGLTLYSGADDGYYLIVGSPFAGGHDVFAQIAQAEGAVAGAGGFSNILIASSPEPGFRAALQNAGAWLVLPVPQVLGCLADGGKKELS